MLAGILLQVNPMMDDEMVQPLVPHNERSTSCGASSSQRILDRDGAFSQSRGRWHVSNLAINNSSTSSATRQRRRFVDIGDATATGSSENNSLVELGDGGSPRTTTTKYSPRLLCVWDRMRCCVTSPDFLSRRCWDNWFHNLSYQPTCILILLIFIAYFITIVIFAGVYLFVNTIGVVPDKEGDKHGYCGMDIHNHMQALYFSLSTMATIGYGVSDYYFGDCWTPFIIVLLQVFSAIIFSSLFVGLLFQRLSRGQKRGRTIIFSDEAIIRKVRGEWYLMFRVAELRTRHIIGAKISAFCVRHERCPLSNNRENDAVELETAHYVSHPLFLLNGSRSKTTITSKTMTNKEEPNCESFLEQRILMGLPTVVVHRMDMMSPMMPPHPQWYDVDGLPHSNNRDGSVPNQEEITTFLQDRQAEIIVLLEGTCENTGMTLQARHSYRCEDIEFNKTFVPCVFPNATNGALEVHFSQYHDLLDAPLDSVSCPYVPFSY